MLWVRVFGQGNALSKSFFFHFRFAEGKDKSAFGGGTSKVSYWSDGLAHLAVL